jgi:hypothetical protein
MTFDQPCLLMVIGNDIIDWAMLVSPGETWSNDEVKAYCDQAEIENVYAYPVIGELAKLSINETYEKLEKTLKTTQPLNIPGVFKL